MATGVGDTREIPSVTVERRLGAPASLAAAIASSEPMAQATGRPRAVDHHSERTVVVGLEVDRDGARVVAFTVKDRPFEQPLELPAIRPYRDGTSLQVEIVLHGPADLTFTRRVDAGWLCLDHHGDAEPHIEGDRIRLHRDSFLVELPEFAGFDRIEAAVYRDEHGGTARRQLGSATLTSDRFTPAGQNLGYAELAFATATQPTQGSPSLTPGAVHWPEEFSDPDLYTVYGNAAEAAKRINVVIVPDGYTYAEKALMEGHAQTIVTAFRSRTPYQEHDIFLNYILVYAYSTESGTDQCDCSIVRDTAMNTRFPGPSACGQSECLFYGTDNGGPDCDPNTSTDNIIAAELRAPAQDATIIMVNTSREGGCEGGSRAVFSAATPSAGEIAIHELGHAIADLDDEYATTVGCGTSAGEINTSRNAVQGAWPEWIADLGTPRVGAQYYLNCVYRPSPNCEMRALSQEFCSVCRQQWALSIFGHPRVHPTAPVESGSPSYFVSTQIGLPVDFMVQTRLASGPEITNSFAWKVLGPGYPTPTVVSTGGPTLSRAFSPLGSYTFWCEVVADTNYVKPQKTGGNLSSLFWDVYVGPVPEVSADPIRLLTVERNGANVDLRFEDTGSTSYNLYVSSLPATSPFKVAAAGDGKKECGLAGLVSIGGGMKQLTNYDPSAGLTGNTSILFFLVTADNGPGTEGSLGTNSSLAERTSDSYCNR